MSNPVEDLIVNFQEFVGQVPDLVQPLVVALAATVPFIEGEVAALIGVIGGLHPLVAAPAAMVGNFLSVAVLVLLGSRVRTAVVAGSGGSGTPDSGNPGKPGSKRTAKFQRAFDRFGVPGVSLLGPLVLPTQFTAMAPRQRWCR